MYAFVVFLGLALGLTVVMQVVDEVLPFRAPAALSRSPSGWPRCVRRSGQR